MKIFIIVLYLVLLSSINLYSLDINSSAPVPIDENILFGRLENGLTYYIRRNLIPENRAELRLVMRVGAIHEDDVQLGLAHFLEHLAFNGTENFPGHTMRHYLDSIGMGFMGGTNAWTSYEHTLYLLPTRTDDAGQLDTAFLILSDWSGRINLKDYAIEAERGIVIEEMRGTRGARDRIMSEMFQTLYEGSLFANRRPIGTEEVILNFEHQRLRDFYHDWYRPDLQAVVAVGDFDMYEIRDLIIKHFDFPQRVNPRPIPDITIPEHDDTKFALIVDPEESFIWIRIVHKRPTKQIETIADFREHLISNLMASMLHNRLIEIERQPNSPFVSPWARNHSQVTPLTEFLLTARVTEDGVLEGYKALITELKRAKQHGFHNSELDRAKSRMLANLRSEYQNRNTTPSHELTSLYENHFLRNTPIMNIEFEYQLTNSLFDTITTYDTHNKLLEITTERNRVVMQVGAETTDINHVSASDVLALFPLIQSQELDAFPETVIVQTLIENMPHRVRLSRRERARFDYTLGVYTWRLRNGATVHLKTTDFRNDEIELRVMRTGGLSQAEDDIFLSASSATSIMNRSGIGNLSRSQLDSYLTGKNARLNLSLGSRSELIEGTSSVADFETMMQLLWLSFTELKLDKMAFDTWMNAMSVSLGNLDRSPDFVYREEVNRLMYNNHLRTRRLSVETLLEICHQTAFEFIRSRYDSANGFHFVFVGNITREELQKYIEMYIAPLPAHRVDTSIQDRGLRINRVQERKHVYQGQDHRTVVTMMFANDIENSFRARTTNDALSRILNIMLMEKIREEMSGVYYIHVLPTYLPALFNEVAISIEFGCDPERVDDLIAVIGAEIDLIINNEFEERFLVSFKEADLRWIEQSMRTNTYWITNLLDVLVFGENTNHRMNEQGLIRNLTREDIVEMASRIIDIDSMHIVVLYPEEMRDN